MSGVQQDGGADSQSFSMCRSLWKSAGSVQDFVFPSVSLQVFLQTQAWDKGVCDCTHTSQEESWLFLEWDR